MVQEGFYSVVASTQLVTADKIRGQLSELSPEVSSLVSPMSRTGGLQALVSQSSFKPPELEQIAALGCQSGAEPWLGCAIPSATCSPPAGLMPAQTCLGADVPKHSYLLVISKSQ